MKADVLPVRIVSALLMLLVPVLLVIGSVRLIMMPLWLQIEYTRPGFPVDLYGFTTEDRLAYGGYGITYLLNGEDINYLAELRLPAEKCVYEYTSDGTTCPMFGGEALSHMADVKTVTVAAFAVGLGAMLVGLVSGVWLRRVNRRAFWLALRQGSWLTLTIIVVIVFGAVGAWDFFFDTFHALFFQAGTWRFLYSDTLIRLYPEQFWFDSAVMVGVFTVTGALFISEIARRALNTTAFKA
jgi:integral membrane protein (TIGR01906 family)